MEMNPLNEMTSRYVLPTIEERTSYGYKRLDPYTKLFEERIIFLGQAIDDTVANDVMAQLLTLESMDPDRDIIFVHQLTRWFIYCAHRNLRHHAICSPRCYDHLP
jgi:hypothetical protein